jgi:hypothetical protein
MHKIQVPAGGFRFLHTENGVGDGDGDGVGEDADSSAAAVPSSCNCAFVNPCERISEPYVWLATPSHVPRRLNNTIVTPL